MDSSRLDNRTECVIIVHGIPLFEPHRHQSLITINRTIQFAFELEGPLATNNIEAKTGAQDGKDAMSNEDY